MKQLKRIHWMLITAILTMMITYLLGAFVSDSLNSSEWSENARLITTIIAVLLAGVSMGVSHDLYDNDN